MTTALSGNIFHRQGETCYGKSMYKIWSLYRFTRYDATNGWCKMQKMEYFGAVTVTQVHGQCHHSKESAYDFLFDFNRNYVSIFYRFRDIAGYLSKVADFDPPHLHSAPS